MALKRNISGRVKLHYSSRGDTRHNRMDKQDELPDANLPKVEIGIGKSEVSALIRFAP